ncbi:hypothetical protein [Agathobaculum sp.]|uniref:hypothetical protein n=1 Tax=Agathobaculum sp. TaxID=2048138 RepID=UPI002A820E33|nr:hypothetical protein [Agathobaculum sp.]MDY3618250.1 hypothetical protein [Agathobaculum sp.]
MLKLLKYEWKACARACLPVYGGVLVVALINRLMEVLHLQNMLHGIPQLLAAFAYFGVMVAVFVVTAVILLQRFYKSLLGDEGYLMFTLPVTPAQHIWSKTIIAFVMCVLSGITAMLSVVILAASSSFPVDFASFIADFFRVLTRTEFGVANGLLYIFEAIVMLVIMSLGSILFMYACIALGHLAKKHRVAMAVVWYFVLSTVLQFLFAMVIMAGDSGIYNAMFGWVTYLAEAAQIHVVLLLMCVASAIPGAAFFFGTRYILQNKLNLE